MDTQALWSQIQNLWASLDQHPWITALMGLIVLVGVALLAGHIARILILRVTKILARQPALHWVNDLREHKVFDRLAQMTPSLMVQFGRNLVPDMSDTGRHFLGNLALAITIFVLTRVISALLDAGLDIYSRTNYAKTRPIKGYIQLTKMLLFVFSAIIIVATLIDRSPMLLLSGLGDQLVKPQVRLNAAVVVGQ